MVSGTRNTKVLGAALLAGVVIVSGSAIAATQSEDRSDEVKKSIDKGRARNVILLIGDGMGDSEITIARNYEMGAGGRLALDTLPLTGAMTTYSVLENDPSQPDYTPESASTGTAWSTGSKTSDGRLSTAAGTDEDLTTLIDLAEEAGMPTGNVSTADITDASPAAPMSHVRLRACRGPQDMATCPQDKKTAGGPGSVSEQSIDHEVDVVLGGGRSRYEQLLDAPGHAGETGIGYAEENGYEVVLDKAGMDAATQTPLLGLFTPGDMTPGWEGPTATKPPGPAIRCDEDNRPADEPALDEMTQKAIDLLSQGTSGNNGFFLQVESASIDKRDHASDPCEQIGETINMDQAVDVALDFAAANKDTLVIVTGDHSHTSQIIDTDQADQAPGFTSRLITDEQAAAGGTNWMTVTYGTGSTPGGQGHTGSQIRVAASGPQAANVVGVIDQTEIFNIITRALSLE